jgi:hypothetical protein
LANTKNKNQRERTMQTKSGKGFPIVAVLMLSACGGGGGESATPLSSWTPSQTVIASGKGQEVTFDYDPVTKQVGAITPPSEMLGNYSTKLTIDATGELTALTLTTPTGTNLIFNTTYKLDAATWGATNFNSSAVVANPFYLGWDYQSFGVWQTGLDSTTGTFGAFSVGTPTAGLDIPGTGNPTFTGKVAGSYVSGGMGHAVLADLSVNVDFGSRSLVFSTSNTRTSTDWVKFDPAPGLNLTNPTLNTLNYVSGTNSFTGTLTTDSGLSGSSTGQFYGPAAQELGGVFFLQGSGETYTGAYGGKDITAP